MVAPETLTFGEMLKIWSEVTGRQGVYMQTSVEGYVEAWGIGGQELVDQLVFGEVAVDWVAGVDLVGMQELGIKEEEVLGLRATLEGLKSFA